MSFVIVDRAVEIDGVSGKFSSHLAAFEACMRIRENDWQPIGGGTYFKEDDAAAFETLRSKWEGREHVASADVGE